MYRIKKTKPQSLSLYIFIVAIVLVYLNFLRSTFDGQGVIFNAQIRFISIISGPAFLFLTIVVSLMEGGLMKIRKVYRYWLVLIFFYIIFLLITGALLFENNLRLITFDIILFLFAAAGIMMGAERNNWVLIDKIMMLIFMIHVVVMLFYVRAYSEIITAIGPHARHNIISAYEQIPYFFWGMIYIWPYFALTYSDRSRFYKFTIIVGIIIFYYFSIIYIKKQPFAYLGLFVVLVMFTNNITLMAAKAFKMIPIWITIILFLFFSVEMSQSIDKLQSRFVDKGSVSSTILQSSRISYDYGLINSQFSLGEYAFGRGIGGSVKDTNEHYPEKTTSVLHNGSALVILKGGIAMLLIWYGGWLYFVNEFIFNRNRYLDRYFISVLIPLLGSWIFGFLSPSIAFLLVMLCAGRIMAKRPMVN